MMGSRSPIRKQRKQGVVIFVAGWQMLAYKQ